MTALAQAIFRRSGIDIDGDTLSAVVMFCSAGLLISVLLIISGLTRSLSDPFGKKPAGGLHVQIDERAGGHRHGPTQSLMERVGHLAEHRPGRLCKQAISERLVGRDQDHDYNERSCEPSNHETMIIAEA